MVNWLTEQGAVTAHRCPERFPAGDSGRELRCLKAEGHPGMHGGPGLVNWSTEQGEDEVGSSA